MEKKIFQKARPVFVPGMEAKPDTLAAFRCDFTVQPGKTYKLAIAAHTFCRAYINGVFLGAGPAPAPFGMLKADRYRLEGLKEGLNRLAVEVIGYVPSENNYATHETSCLIAELTEENKVICATGDAGFTCGLLIQKDCEAETLSFGRRVPLEAYHLDEAYTAWRTGAIPGAAACRETGEERIIRERGTAMPDFSIREGFRMLGIYSLRERPEEWKAQSWWESDAYIARCGGEGMKRPAYEDSLLEDTVYEGRLEEEKGTDGRCIYKLSGHEAPAALEFVMEEAETGFIGIAFSSEGPVTVDILWNDYLDGRGLLPVKADNVNRVIRLYSEGGRFAFEAMEPHFLKYIKVIFRGGKRVSLDRLYVRTYHFPDSPASGFVCSDKEMNRIYEGARRTLLTNSLAFFLDSPERERGGWAGDSYWTGRAAAMLLSDTTLERSMLTDFLAADYSVMQEGSFPACCSGGARKDPCMMYSWNLFLLLELTDYYRRTWDEEMKEAYRERVSLFLEASQAYKNSLGILENIPGSMFIDWSQSNDASHTAPICTAANGLYAFTLQRLGEMYHRADYIEEAECVRAVFRKVYDKVKGSRNDLFTMYPFLPDSMTVTEDGLTGNGAYSEAAQYYYFWTGLLSVKDAPALWKILKEEYGPCPEKYRGTAHLRVGNCGVFFGYMMRFELLARHEETALLEKEMKHLCGYMLSQDPGTFWETLSGTDSRNHGFGAYYGAILMRVFLGMEIPDRENKRVCFAPHPGSLKWAKGTMDTADGRISAFWRLGDEGIRMEMSAPEGYQIEAVIPEEYGFTRCMTVNGVQTDISGPILTGNKLSLELRRKE